MKKRNYATGYFIVFMIIIQIPVLRSFSIAQNYPVYKVDDITVTATRTPTELSELTRSVVILTADDISRIVASNLNDVLEYVAGVDVMQRGVEGAQADVRVRGCSFEQTLILVDGVKINDPQTGHHNMDLPVTLADIQRVEILKGHGSHLYGPNAFGGVINFITKNENEKSAEITAAGGDFRYGEGGLSLFYPLFGSNNHISISKRKSDGYRPDTEFDISNIYLNSSYKVEGNQLTVGFGHTDKKFGGNSFYSDIFPDEWEHTRTYFLNTAARINSGAFNITPKILWRRHKDDFVLDRERPDWYRNIHTTDIYEMEIQNEFLSVLGSSVVGGEFCLEEITGNSLGDHSRTRTGIFIEHSLNRADRLLLTMGASVNRFARWGWTFNPSVGAGYYLSNNIKLFSSAGRSFRIPTFTELYYVSPANIGDENLRPEKSYSYELGLSFLQSSYLLKTSVFLRDGKDLIDWTRADGSEPWRISNISSMTTGGFESEFEFYPDFGPDGVKLSRIRADYSYLDSNRKTGDYESKYALNYLRHQMKIGAEIALVGKIINCLTYRYEDRVGGNSFSVVDYRLQYRWKYLKAIIDISNLFNADYRDISSIPMPGRWFKFTLNYSLSL